MGTFDHLMHDQTLFSNPDALDPDFVPKLLPFRENQQKHIATSINPLFHGRYGNNLLIKGATGIGKTVTTRRVLIDLDEVEEASNIPWVYVNCWKANTTYKVAVQVCHALGFKFTQNMKTNEILNKISKLLEDKKGVVLALDEIDKAEEYDFLYHLLEETAKKTILLITNDYEWGRDLDPRIKSRLVPEIIEFAPYTPEEIKGILKERVKYAFYENVWTPEAFDLIAKKASEVNDIRAGITLLKAAGELAESQASKTITLDHTQQAIDKTTHFSIKPTSSLSDDEQLVMELCKNHSGKIIGELYALYKAKGNKSEKTFRRILDKLENRKVISLEATGEGFRGKSSIVYYIGTEKKLSDFTTFE